MKSSHQPFRAPVQHEVSHEVSSGVASCCWPHLLADVHVCESSCHQTWKHCVRWHDSAPALLSIYRSPVKCLYTKERPPTSASAMPQSITQRHAPGIQSFASSPWMSLRNLAMRCTLLALSTVAASTHCWHVSSTCSAQHAMYDTAVSYLLRMMGRMLQL